MAMAACTNSSIKTKHIKVKHPKRKLYRASEPLLSVFMWGINHTVRELSHISIPVMLMPDDFRAFTKIKVDNFAFNKENLPSHFKARKNNFFLFVMIVKSNIVLAGMRTCFDFEDTYRK